MANLRLKAYLAVASLTMVIACKKDKNAPAVVEELPQTPEVQNTDTSAMMQEEPALSQVGGSHSGSMTNSGISSSGNEGFVKNGRYVVQVSVFKSSQKASLAVEKLAALGYPGYVAAVEDPTPDMAGTWHRVRVGTFQTLSAAKNFGENTLRPMGYDFWVDKKSMDNVGARGGNDSYSSPSPSYSSPSNSSYSPEPDPEPSSATITPSTPEPSMVTEPPAPEQHSAPATDDWNATPTPATPEPPAPSAVQAWDTPSEPAPSATTPGWGTPTETAPPPANSTPPDTGAVKLDDW